MCLSKSCLWRQVRYDLLFVFSRKTPKRLSIYACHFDAQRTFTTNVIAIVKPWRIKWSKRIKLVCSMHEMSMQITFQKRLLQPKKIKLQNINTKISTLVSQLSRRRVKPCGPNSQVCQNYFVFCVFFCVFVFVFVSAAFKWYSCYMTMTYTFTSIS